jgi:CHAT domain-containing protein/tetratricopeptide (TPR) repeat protein
MARKRSVFLGALHTFLRIPGLKRRIYCGLLTISLLCSFTIQVQASSPADLIQQGQSYYEQGQFPAALHSWQQAEVAYRQTSNMAGITGSRSNQAQALIALGRYRRACKALVTAAQTTENICTTGIPQQFGIRQTNLPLALQAQVLNNLGEVLRLVGNLPGAQTTLIQAWQVAKTLNPVAQAEVLLSIGNNLRDLGNRDRDRTNRLPTPSSTVVDCPTQVVIDPTENSYYQQSITCYQAAHSLKAQLNQLSLQVEVSRWLQKHPQSVTLTGFNHSAQNTLIEQIKPQLTPVAKTIEGLNQRINFAHNLVLADHPQRSVAESMLKSVITTAHLLKNSATIINGTGTLGWLYEQDGQWQNALQFTQQTLALVNANDDHLYQWEWQLGRILRQQRSPTAARAAYQRAVAALEKTRGDLRAINADAQFSLRDSVEPLYRELVDLSLKSNQPDLSEVIAKIDDLQLAELENFLQCQLSATRSVNDFAEDSGAVVFYPIILADRLELILRLPGNRFERVVVPVTQVQLENTVKELRHNLTNPQFGWKLSLAGNLYDWLIRPAHKYLNTNTKNLVFVLDGALQNVPMSALYDRQRREYAIDQYPLAVTPGLKILGAKNSGTGRLRQQADMLVGGLTTVSGKSTNSKRTLNYAALQYAGVEVQGIKKLFPKATELVGRNFTVENIRRLLGERTYGIIHLATHGNFSSDPSQTFIVTDGGGSINLDSLQEMLRQRGGVDLMVLSACETAAGDRRASLGLAGVALKSGAASTLASLWSVDDGATAELMQGFYGAWQGGMSKAQALRVAQQQVRRDHPHPYYWAAFMLVGNWL